MTRLLAITSLTALIGCADRSMGAALNECRQKYYLQSPGMQAELIPECMRAKSFQPVMACAPQVNEREWDLQVVQFSFNNFQCYRPLGSKAWVASALSPM